MKIISDLLTISDEIDESAAATWSYTDVSVPSAIREGIAFRIVGIDIESYNPADQPAAGSYETVESYVMEEKETTEPEPTDPDVIGKLTIVEGGFAAGTTQQDRKIGLVGKLLDPRIAGVNTGRDRVYIGIISTNAAATANAKIKIYGYQVKLTQNELVEMGFRESFE